MSNLKKLIEDVMRRTATGEATQQSDEWWTTSGKVFQLIKIVQMQAIALDMVVKRGPGDHSPEVPVGLHLICERTAEAVERLAGEQVRTVAFISQFDEQKEIREVTYSPTPIHVE